MLGSVHLTGMAYLENLGNLMNGKKLKTKQNKKDSLEGQKSICVYIFKYNIIMIAI